MSQEKDPKVSAKICFDSIGLDPELYRIGHTKASKLPSIESLEPFSPISVLFLFVISLRPFFALDLKHIRSIPIIPITMHLKFCECTTFIQFWTVIVI